MTVQAACGTSVLQDSKVIRVLGESLPDGRRPFPRGPPQCGVGGLRAKAVQRRRSAWCPVDRCSVGLRGLTAAVRIENDP